MFKYIVLLGRVHLNTSLARRWQDESVDSFERVGHNVALSDRYTGANLALYHHARVAHPQQEGLADQQARGATDGATRVTKENEAGLGETEISQK